MNVGNHYRYYKLYEYAVDVFPKRGFGDFFFRLLRQKKKEAKKKTAIFQTGF